MAEKFRGKGSRQKPREKYLSGANKVPVEEKASELIGRSSISQDREV